MQAFFPPAPPRCVVPERRRSGFLLQQLPCPFSRRDGRASGHESGQLGYSTLFAESLDGCRGAAVPDVLRDMVVGGGVRRDLREVGDAQHLEALGQRAEHPAHAVGDGAADAGVHLVEYQRLPGAIGRRERLEPQHHPRQLAARRRFRQRAGLLAGIRGEVELDLVDTARAPALGGQRRVRETGLHASMRHRQALEHPGQLFAQRSRRALPLLGQSLRHLQKRAAGVGRGGCQPFHLVGVSAQGVELLPDSEPPVQHVLQLRAVLLLQAFQQRQPGLGLGEPRRGRVDAGRIRSQREREVLELRADGVPAREVLGERRIDVRQLLQSPPHATELREHRSILLVQLAVRVSAQREQPLGVGEAGP